MPENEKETRSCHDCGLEDICACEKWPYVHQSSLKEKLPCSYCVRNPENIGWYDFYHEAWTLDGNKKPILEDPDPHGVTLLKALHGIVQHKLVPIPKVEVRVR